ncbi:hypothetical protein ACIF8T_25985 [Streptomyces sp. NPDC085946]|uniref:hypothetical protein n=1 Tax=Streptomyces sp. NPDC085946 TaxID=3365744 RepID=UPI0037CE04CF
MVFDQLLPAPARMVFREHRQQAVCDCSTMSNDYDRIRTGIEFMTAYVSGDELLTAYLAERRHEDPAAAEKLMDGVSALCALLLHKLARDTGQTEHVILQELARGTHRHEQQSDD